MNIAGTDLDFGTALRPGWNNIAFESETANAICLRHDVRPIVIIIAQGRANNNEQKLTPVFRS
jgi:hypothetical protein